MADEHLEIFELETTSSYSNLTFNATEPSIKRKRSHLFVAKVAVQAFILGLAIFGNTCLFLALQRRRRNFTRMHVFITHLCFADMLVAFFNILPQLIWDLIGEWIAGDVMCKFVKFMQIYVMYLSTYVLVLTALDRRRAICSPLLSHTWTYRLVHLSVACVYILAAVLSVPQAIIFKYQHVSQGSERKDCWVHFEPEWTLRAYVTSFTILVYVLPLVTLVYAYGSISYAIFVRHRQCKLYNGKLNSGGAQRNTKANNMCKRVCKNISGSPMIPRSSSFAGFTRAKIKTVKLTFVIIMAYITCWSPFFISQLWWLYDESAPRNNKALVIMLLLASLNSCCNPWIYMAFSGTFSCCNVKQLKRCLCLESRFPSSKNADIQKSFKKSNSITTTRSPSWVKIMTTNQTPETAT